MSGSIHGPWEFKGIVNELAGNCQTEFPPSWITKGATYFIYHNGSLPGGDSFRRSVCMLDRLYFNEDGTIRRNVIMTSEAPGRRQVRNVTIAPLKGATAPGAVPKGGVHL